MWIIIQVLLIIILVLGIIVLGKYLHIKLNRPKIKLPSFKGRGRVDRFIVITIIVALIFGIITIGIVGAIIYDQSQPKVEWREQEVTEVTVRNAIESVVWPYSITRIEVLPYEETADPDDRYVHVHYNATSMFDIREHWENTYSFSQSQAMELWEALFQNDHIGVASISMAKNYIVDEYGNSETWLLTRFTMRKEIAEKIVNWSVAGQNFSKLADVEYIHPDMGKALRSSWKYIP